METSRIDQSLQSHYQAMSLDRQALDGIQEVINHERAVMSRRSLVRTWLAPSAAAAASVAITLGTVALYERDGRPIFDSQSHDATHSSAKLIASASQSMPGLIAVRLHADWCRVSQRMMPLASQLKAQYGTDRVLFVDLNLTDEASRRQAEFLKHSLGLTDQWREENWQSGELLIVQAAEKQLFARLGPDDSMDQMLATIDQALHNNAG